MRKLLTLTLAVAMVLSLASVAFAAFTVSGDLHAESDNIVKTDTLTVSDDGQVGYGKSVYVATGVDTYDEAKDLKVKATWSENGDRVDSVKVIRKTKGAAGTTEYYIQINTKKDVTLDSNNINGKLELTLSKNNFGGGATDTKKTVNVFFTLGYSVANSSTSPNTATTATLTDSDKIYKFDKATATAPKFNYDEEFEFRLYGMTDATFVVDTDGQGDILVSNTVKYNEGLEDIFGDDNYVYINGNGAAFNKTGVLTIPAEEGQQLYSIKANGKMEPAKNAKYDEVEEAFIVSTRTLGKYVIADKEYETKVVTPEAPAEEVAPVNPGTGAAA